MDVSLPEAVNEFKGSIDASYMLFSAYLVFFMQAGFAMPARARGAARTS